MSHPDFIKNRIKYCREVDVDLIEDPIFVREEPEDDLIESVKHHGVFSVIYVRELPGGRYRIIDGKRRKNAFRKLGVKKVHVCVVDVADELEELALIRAFSVVKPMSQRDFIRYIEAWVSRGVRDYREIMKRVGVKKSSIYRAFWVLSFPEDIKRAFVEEKVPLSLADVVHKTLPILGEDFVTEVFRKVTKVAESKKEAGITITRILERAYKTVKEMEEVGGEGVPKPPETQPIPQEEKKIEGAETQVQQAGISEESETEHGAEEKPSEAPRTVQTETLTIKVKEVKLDYVKPVFQGAYQIKVDLEKLIEEKRKDMDAYTRRRLKRALNHLQKALDILAEFV